MLCDSNFYRDSDWLSLALRTPSPVKYSPFSRIYSPKYNLANIFPKPTSRYTHFSFRSPSPVKFSQKTTHTSSYDPSSPTLLSASRKASETSDSYSGPSSYGSSYPTSYDDLINSPAKYPTDSHLQMIASPFPLQSQPSSSSFVISPPKLSPVTPSIFFTPQISPVKPYTPGTSPIEHSPKPFRRLITMDRKPEPAMVTRRFDSEELDGDFDDALLSTDEDEEEEDSRSSPCDLMAKFVQSDEEDEDISASPATTVYFRTSALLPPGITPSTPRAEPGPPVKSPFSSPLSPCSPSSSEGSLYKMPHSPPKVMRKITQFPGRVVSGRSYRIFPGQALGRDVSPVVSLFDGESHAD